MRIIVYWITLLAIAQLCPLLGSDSESDRRTLAGITAVNVLVEPLPPGAAKLGITEEFIRTDVELKLRLAGLRVMEHQDTIDLTPILYVNVNVTDSSRAVHVIVELEQSAKLARNPTISALPSTWSTASLGENLNAQEIRNVVKDLVDQFLNAWLSVNPKK